MDNTTKKRSLDRIVHFKQNNNIFAMPYFQQTIIYTPMGCGSTIDSVTESTPHKQPTLLLTPSNSPLQVAIEEVSLTVGQFECKSHHSYQSLQSKGSLQQLSDRKPASSPRSGSGGNLPQPGPKSNPSAQVNTQSYHNSNSIDEGLVEAGPIEMAYAKKNQVRKQSISGDNTAHSIHSITNTTPLPSPSSSHPPGISLTL